jgi:hypothetical protein
LETPGPLCHGTRGSVDLLVRVLACLAEGWGSRGTARGCEVDPKTGRQWLVEAAEPRQALAPSCRHDLHLTPGPLDALYAVLRAVKDGPLSEAKAIARLFRSPQGGDGAGP